MNVADLLRDSALRAPERAAIISADGHGGWKTISYRDLNRSVDAWAQRLKASGIIRGELSLVMVPAGIPLISLFYALLRIGAVPVMIDPGMGFKAFLNCVETTEAKTLVGIPKAHIARLFFARVFRTVEKRLVVGSSPLGMLGQRIDQPAGGSMIEDGIASDLRADLSPDDPAAILFTSGSTGPAKGACYSVRNFFAQRDALQNLYNFREGEVDLAAFPLFSLFDAAFGMTSVIPDIDPSKPAECNPQKIAEALLEHQATSAFGSPAIWTRVAPWCAEKKLTFPALKRVLMAGAPVPVKLVRAMRRVLPTDGDVHIPYGATESLPVASISGCEVESCAPEIESGAGTCVGTPSRDIEVRIIPIGTEAIDSMDGVEGFRSGEIGEICVRGNVVTREYHHRAEATRASKIGQGAETWHRMGDVGYLDALGRLWFCGRKAEAVATPEGLIFTDRIECRFSSDSRFGRVALVGVNGRPVLVIEGAENAELRAEAGRKTGLSNIRFHPHFPVDRRHNAKIHRHELAKWAALNPPAAPAATKG